MIRKIVKILGVGMLFLMMTACSIITRRYYQDIPPNAEVVGQEKETIQGFINNNHSMLIDDLNTCYWLKENIDRGCEVTIRENDMFISSTNRCRPMTVPKYMFEFCSLYNHKKTRHSKEAVFKRHRANMMQNLAKNYYDNYAGLDIVNLKIKGRKATADVIATDTIIHPLPPPAPVLRVFPSEEVIRSADLNAAIDSVSARLLLGIPRELPVAVVNVISNSSLSPQAITGRLEAAIVAQGFTVVGGDYIFSRGDLDNEILALLAAQSGAHIAITAAVRETDNTNRIVVTALDAGTGQIITMAREQYVSRSQAIDTQNNDRAANQSSEEGLTSRLKNTLKFDFLGNMLPSGKKDRSNKEEAEGDTE